MIITAEDILPPAAAAEHIGAELDHNQLWLDRLHDLKDKMFADLLAQGLTGQQAYDTLAQSKTYRQLRRDEATYQQTWRRAHTRLMLLADRTLDQAARAGHSIIKEDIRAERIRAFQNRKSEQAQPAPQQPIVKPPEPGRNSPCPCGSGTKYKRCCGDPARPKQPAMAA